MSAKRQKDEGWISWGLIVLLFIFGLSPLALVLLFLKLFGVGSGEKKQQAAPPPLQETTGQRTSERVGRQASQPNRAQKTVHQVMKAPSQKKSTARTLMIVGAILARTIRGRRTGGGGCCGGCGGCPHAGTCHAHREENS